MSKGRKHSNAQPDRLKGAIKDKSHTKDEGSEWGECECCGQNLPIVAETGMCGPCTFGEADSMFDV